ncbi:MAG TPA: indolepyruvate ferredoxin oxidoreductase subunit alpha [Nitrospirota bacterium]|nr:indolepyruvate ferredoxin oxidoreductase subunit alpha [Nitrospirota bacterium]
MKKAILSGNEAIARGFLEAGGRLATAYPGTPSTEVLELLSKQKSIHAEWSTNEKVALEVAMGGSLAGVRSLACMKHVGVNVAADPLLTASYTGVNAGLVLMAADDPGMFSSQNEQDTRHYARMAKIPCLEPTDSAEAHSYVREAFELSETFDTPVILRTTTRISHCKSVVELGEPAPVKDRDLARDVPKYVMLPANAKKRHVVVEERLAKLKDWAETTKVNQVIEGSGDVGFIANGVAFQYVREAFPQAPVLKLGLTYPLPEKKIRAFAATVKQLAIVEELDGFVEEQVKAMGIAVHFGKASFTVCGEMTSRLINDAVTGKPLVCRAPVPGLIMRPPTFCPGCSHRGLYTVLAKLKPFVSGDIGCYTLGALPPFSSMHTCICMGASISAAHGIARGLALKGVQQKPVAVIGDSTFMHSGITGLIDMVYNGGDALVVVMNNDTTGMTGGQEHPGTGRRASGAEAPKISIEKLCQTIGAKRVREIDTYDIKALEKIIKEELAKPGPSVLVSNQPCVLRFRVSSKPYVVERKTCIGCKLCLKAGCIALSFTPEGKTGYVEVDPLLCNGCGVCAQLCTTNSMAPAK